MLLGTRRCTCVCVRERERDREREIQGSAVYASWGVGGPGRQGPQSTMIAHDQTLRVFLYSRPHSAFSHNGEKELRKMVLTCWCRWAYTLPRRLGRATPCQETSVLGTLSQLRTPFHPSPLDRPQRQGEWTYRWSGSRSASRPGSG